MTLSFILNSVLFYFILSRLSLLQEFHPLSSLVQNWWFKTETAPSAGLKPIIFIHGLIAFATLSGSLALNLSFKRSSSQEIFYFQLFILCLSLLSLRLFSYVIALYHLPFAYTVLLSRAILFFRFNSLLFLLLSGLSVFDSRFQKSDPFFLASLVISLCLAATIPMGSQFISNTLSYLPVNELSLFFLFLIIKLIIPVNFLWFVYQRKTVDYIILTGATLLCIVAESMIYYMTYMSCFLGVLCLSVGTALFSNRIYKLYLWR